MALINDSRQQRKERRESKVEEMPEIDIDDDIYELLMEGPFESRKYDLVMMMAPRELLPCVGLELLLTIVVGAKSGGPSLMLPVKKDRKKPEKRPYEHIIPQVSVDDYADLTVHDFEAEGMEIPEHLKA